MKFLIIILALSCSLWAANPAAENCQETQGSTDTPAITSFVYSNAGDAVFVVSFSSSTSATATIAGGSQTYTQMGCSGSTCSGGYIAPAGGSRATGWTITNGTSALNGATITVTWTGGTTTTIIACEVSNTPTSSLLDGTPLGTSTTSNSTTLTSGSMTTTNADDLLVYAVQASGALGTVTVGTGFAIPSGGSGTKAFVQTEYVTSTQSGLTTAPSWANSVEPIAGLFFAIKAANTSTLTMSPAVY
jgi:hypothetical protein